MSRIPSVAPQDASPLVRIAYRYARRRLGEVPEPFAVTASGSGTSPSLRRA